MTGAASAAVALAGTVGASGVFDAGVTAAAASAVPVTVSFGHLHPSSASLHDSPSIHSSTG